MQVAPSGGTVPSIQILSNTNMAYTSGAGIVFPMIMMRSIYSRPLVTGNTRITRISINVTVATVHCSGTMCPAVDSVTESWNGATATAQRQQQQQQ